MPRTRRRARAALQRGSARPRAATIVDALRMHGFDVVGTSDNWGDALVALRSERPDVAVSGPAGLAIDAFRRDVRAWARAGMSDYVTRDGMVKHLIRAVRAAARHEAHCRPSITGALSEEVHDLAVSGPPSGPVASSTAREHEIAELLEAGLSSKEIAAQLQIELATVKNHVHGVLTKLEVHRRADAAAHMRRARHEFANTI